MTEHSSQLDSVDDKALEAEREVVDLAWDKVLEEDKPKGFYMWTQTIKPLVSAIKAFAELVLLATVFKIAADLSGHWFMEAMSFALLCCIACYAAIPLGAAMRAYDKLRNRRLWVMLLSSTALSLLTLLFLWVVVNEVSQSIAAMAEVTSQ